MRCFVVLCCTATLVACARPEDRATDTATPATAMPAPITAGDVAGRWTTKTMDERGDSALVTYTFTATADTTGWSITFPNRPPIPMRVVAIAGDSITIEAGPYESALRRGVNVTTVSVIRLQDGKLVGTGRARYATRGPDSVLVFRLEGSRLP